MLLLPRNVGPFTLLRRLGTSGVAESFLGVVAGQGDQTVVLRRLLPYIRQDPDRAREAEERVRDLTHLQHPFLVRVMDWVEDGDERFVVEAFVDGIDLGRLLDWCRARDQTLPTNVLLNLATQLCNGLEAVHGRPGQATGTPNVLHLGIRPSAVVVSRDGKVVLGGFGLVKSPATLPHGGLTGSTTARLRYLAPEQAPPGGPLSPATDIFSLGTLLYEMVTLRPLFPGQTDDIVLESLREADLAEPLQAVRELLPGIDRVLQRCLSRNPRYRYNRAFVLREDLRALMAGYSFNTIVDDTRRFLRPVVGADADDMTAESAPVNSALGLDLPDDSLAVAAPIAALAGLPPLDDAPAERAPPSAALPPPPAELPPVAANLGAPPAVQAPPPVTDLPIDVPAFAAPSLGAPPPEVAPPAALAPTEIPHPEGIGEVPAEPAMALTAPKVDLPTPPPPPWTTDAVDPPDAGGLSLPPPVVDDLSLPPPVAASAQSGDEEETLADVTDGDLPAHAGAFPLADALLAGSGRPGATSLADLFAPEPPRRFDPRRLADALQDESIEEDGAARESGLTEALAIPPGGPPPPAAPPDTTGMFVRGLPGAPLAPPPPDTTGMFMRGSPGAPLSAPPPESLPPDEILAPPTMLPPPEAPPPVEVPAPLPPFSAAPPPALPPLDAPVPPQPLPPESESESETPQPPAAPPAVSGRAPPPQSRPPAPAADSAPDEEGASRPARRSLWPLIGAGALVALLFGVWAGGIWLAGSLEGDDPAPEPDVAAAVPAVEAPKVVADEEPPAVADIAPLPSEGVDILADEEPDPEAIPEAAPAPRPTRAAPPPRVPSSSRSDRADAIPVPPPRAPAPPPAPTPPRPAATPTPAPPPPPTAEPDSVEPRDAREPEAARRSMDDQANRARSGQLDAEDVQQLEGVNSTEPDYTRARVLLLIDAQRRDDVGASGRYLEDILRVPENRYNPVFLAEMARHQVNQRQFAVALGTATKAEQHWARLPSSLVFDKQAEIFEVQAAATQGLLYEAEAEAEQLSLLDDALGRWRRLAEHAQRGGRPDISERATAQIAKLEDIRRRLQ